MRRASSLLLAAAVIVMGACGPPPEPVAPPKATAAPRPSPPPTATASAAPEPEATIAEGPPEAPLLDPLAPLPPGAVMRLGTTRMRFRGNDTPLGALSASGAPVVLERAYRSTAVRDLLTDRVIVEGGSSDEVAIAPDASFAVTTRPKGDTVAVSMLPIAAGAASWAVEVKAPKTTVKFFKTTRQMAAHVRGLVVSPNGSHAAVAFSTGDVFVLSAKDGAVTGKLKPRAGRFAGLSRDGAAALFLEDEGAGRYFAPSRVKTVEVIDARTNAVLRKLEPNVSAAVEISPDGKEILALTAESLVAVHVATGARRVILDEANVQSDLTSWSRSAGSMLVSADGSRAAIWQSKARVVRLADGVVEKDGLLGTPVCFSADGALLLVRDGKVARIEGKASDVPEGHTVTVKDLAFASGGRLLASLGEDVRFWSPRSGRMFAQAPSVKGARALASDPAAEMLVVARPELAALGSDGKLVELGPLEPEGFSKTPRRPRVESAALISSEAVAVTVETSFFGSSGHKIRVWSTKEDREIAKANVQSAGSVVAGPDGERVAITGSAPGVSGTAVHVLDAKTLEPYRMLSVDGWGRVPLAFVGSDARIVAGAGYRAGLSLFDVDRSVVTKRFHAGSCCSAVAASRDGRLIAAAADKAVLLWQVEPRRLQAVLRGHKEAVQSLEFSPDGALLASSSDDTSVLVWDTSIALPPPRASFAVRVPDVSSMRRFAPDRSGFIAATDPVRSAAPILRDGGINSEGKVSSVDLKVRLADVTALAATGDATCALDGKGEVRCWGWPFDGAVGIKPPVIPKGAGKAFGAGVRKRMDTPQLVKLPGKATNLFSGSEYVCALLTDGRLTCWGTLLRWRHEGVPGHEALVKSMPTVVSGLGEVVGAGVGDGFACALEKTGLVLCWGSGAEGQLGPIQGKGSVTPVPIAGITGARSIAVGRSHACALLASGEVTCWGDNEMDQLGDGTGLTSRIPKTVGTGFVEVAAGGGGTCGRQTSGDVLCWGIVGRAGTLPWLSPTKLPEGDGLEQLRFMEDMLCGLRKGSEVVCVGARAPDL